MHKVRLSVRGAYKNASSLPFGDLLSSTGSATAVAALFARFVGTTRSSDFPTACMPAVPPGAFSGRSESCDLEAMGISRFSHLEFPDMLRFYDSAVPARHLPIAQRAVLPSTATTAWAHGSWDFGAQ